MRIGIDGAVLRAVGQRASFRHWRLPSLQSYLAPPQNPQAKKKPIGLSERRRANPSKSKKPVAANLRATLSPLRKLMPRGTEAQLRPKDIADAIISAGKKARGEISSVTPPPVGSMAHRIVRAGAKARAEIPPALPPSGSLAARIVAAGAKARGESIPQPPRGSVAEAILKAGAKARGEI